VPIGHAFDAGDRGKDWAAAIERCSRTRNVRVCAGNATGCGALSSLIAAAAEGFHPCPDLDTLSLRLS